MTAPTTPDTPHGTTTLPRPSTPAPSNPSALPLRPHQRRAVSNQWRALKDGGRVKVISACGSGKTLMGVGAARRLAAKGRVLVLVPTIDLLDQTAEAWSVLGRRRGRAIAACSVAECLELAEAGAHSDAQVTTDAATLARLVTDTTGPVTLYATYASLERIVTAHAEHGLPPWDLAIIDEAHRTAGAADKSWAAIHRDSDVPCVRRANYTATERIADIDVEGTAETADLYSMDNREIFGDTVFRFTVADAIAQQLIADYEILVPVVTDEDLRELLTMPAIADLRSQRTNAELQELALGIGILRAMVDEDLSHVLTYHSRVAAARSFAKALPDIAALLPEHSRPKVWARAVAGTDRLKTRREAFAEFSACTEGAVLCNSRLLSEGIDLKAKLQAVVFADPKGSVVDIVQAAGRALRQQPGEGKKARIIIPVYLPAVHPVDEASQEPTVINAATNAEHYAQLDTSAFRDVWRVLRAMAVHDARMVGRIADLRTHRTPPAVPSSATDGTEADEATSAAMPFEWLKINAKDHQDELLHALTLRTFAPRAEEWDRNYALAKAFYDEHGHLDVREGPLVSWMNQQRYLNSSDLLPKARVDKLDAIGMIWDRHDYAWERGYAHALVWHREHGHLAIPKDDVHEGFARGMWMSRQRKNIDKLTPAQRARFDALDPLWALDPGWNRGYRRMSAYLAAGGTLTGPIHRPGPANDPKFAPGRWQKRQVVAYESGKLNQQQIALLDAFGTWRAA